MKYEEMITEKILDVLGLSRKPSATSQSLGAVGLIGVGMVAGAALALLLTPVPGTELREEVKRRLNRKTGNGEALDELIT